MENIYLPQLASIDFITDETPDTKTFTLHFLDPEINDKFRFKSGQFAEISVFGIGEAPFGFSSNPSRHGSFDITVRAIGSVTDTMHKMKPGDILGVRAPLGNHFPFEEAQGYDILFVAGGIGLPPLKSLIEPMLDKRGDFGDFTILYGSRTPQDLVFKPILNEWAERKDVNVFQTVDQADNGWTGNIGVVTTLFEKIKINASKTVAFTCGPPIMIRFVIQELLVMGFI